MAALKYDVDPVNAEALAVGGGVLVVVSVLAALVPGWRAGRADPASALKADQVQPADATPVPGKSRQDRLKAPDSPRHSVCAGSRHPASGGRMENRTDGAYPVTLDIDYPDRELDRLTTFFRPFTIIPIGIILALVSGPALHVGSSDTAIESGGLIMIATVLMIVFRQKYPRWWFDWNLAMARFGLRVAVYGALLDDRYPSTDATQSVHFEAPYPDVERDLNRWLPLVKWLLVLPHVLVLAILSAGAVASVIIAWIAILFTGRYPRPLFDFVVGVLRWWSRVSGYAFLLATDRYPPFQLS